MSATLAPRIGQTLTPEPPPIGCVTVELKCENVLCGEDAEIFVRGAVTVDFARGLSANCPVCQSQMRARAMIDPRRRIATRIKPI